MTATRWLLAVPLALVAALGTAEASEVRDQAKMFSPDAIQKAQATLDRLEGQTRVPTIIETIPSLEGESIDEASLRRAKESGIQGVYLLIAQQEKKLAARDYRNFLGRQRRKAIEAAIASGFRTGDFDAGLLQGTEAIARAVAEAGPPPAGRDAKAPPVGARRGGSSGFGILLVIGAVILGVLFLTRLFGRRGAGQPGYGMPGQPNAMGQPGYGPGGYGAPGYGGRGGFWQGMLGGLGGAMAGNWLYHQFSGRHHDPGYGGPSALPPDHTTGADWGGGDGGTSWGGGADGGTSWGGGDAGGGGGDWGGGGGDWGGGDGGGDWT